MRLDQPAVPQIGAQVAQLVEHVTENHGVGGSSWTPSCFALTRFAGLQHKIVKQDALRSLGGGGLLNVSLLRADATRPVRRQVPARQVGNGSNPVHGGDFRGMILGRAIGQ